MGTVFQGVEGKGEKEGTEERRGGKSSSVDV